MTATAAATGDRDAAGSAPPRGRVRRRRRWLLWVGLIAFVSGVSLGIGAYRWKKHAAAKYVPPVFVEPAAGPRAPDSEWLGARVGFSRLGEIESTTATWALSCSDKGMRAMMTELREKKRAEIAQAEAQGKPDAISGASILTRRTARDDNPQVRWNCGGVPSNALKDRTRLSSSGRLLFVFDDETAPLRHVSYQRSHRDWASAVSDYRDAREAMARRFGQPVEKGAATDITPEAELPKYGRREAEWRFSDLVASVSIANLGSYGFSVSEVVEVPWPVRADAPARK